jgi:hypothetical protein
LQEHSARAAGRMRKRSMGTLDRPAVRGAL